MVSTSQDRFLRLHSVISPGEPGKPLEKKGEILGSLFLHSTPTSVACDPLQVFEDQASHLDESDEDEDVWNELHDVDDSEPEESGTKRRRPKLT